MAKKVNPVVHLDFSVPPEKTIPGFHDEDLDSMTIDQLVALGLSIGIDPRELLGVDRCTDAGKHKPATVNLMSKRGAAVTHGVNLLWCKECISWVVTD